MLRRSANGVNREFRDRLAACLICWMSREVGSDWLDDRMTGEDLWPPKPNDDGYILCWKIVWATYDDFTDHVFWANDPSQWELLLRTLAFLRSDLETGRIARRSWFRWPAEGDPIWECQPFESQGQWDSHSRFVAEESIWTPPLPLSRSAARQMAEALRTMQSKADSEAADPSRTEHRSFRLTKR